MLCIQIPTYQWICFYCPFSNFMLQNFCRSFVVPTYSKPKQSPFFSHPLLTLSFNLLFQIHEHKISWNTLWTPKHIQTNCFVFLSGIFICGYDTCTYKIWLHKPSNSYWCTSGEKMHSTAASAVWWQTQTGTEHNSPLLSKDTRWKLW